MCINMVEPKSNNGTLTATITIDFLNIGGNEIDQNLINQNPKIIESTKNAVDKLCGVIQNYYKGLRIIVDVKCEVK